MPITNSPKLGYSIPGATIADTRVGDISAIKSALLSLDNIVGSAPAAPASATTSSAGLMSAEDKVKLDSLPPVYSKTETDDRIQAVVGAAPAALDTLAEIATQLTSDGSAVSALTTTVATKAATTYVDAQLATKSNVDHTHSLATGSQNGLMSATDKSALDGLPGLLSIEQTDRINADNDEVTNRDSAITTAIASEVTNRDTAIASAVTTLKGTATTDADTLGKLQGLITGTNSGTNTGDETTTSIKSKLGISTLTGSNTGDQVLPTTLPASDVFAWAKNALKPSYTAAEVGLGNVDNKSSATIKNEILSNIALTLIDTSTLAVAGGYYVFTESCPLTLPPSPANGDVVNFSNKSGTLTCKIIGNGNKVADSLEDLVLDTVYSAYGRVVFANATLGWIFI